MKLSPDLEAHNARKGRDPTALFCIRGRDIRGEPNGQSLGMVGGRGGGVWKCRFPRLEVLRVAEQDVGEKVLSSARNPRFGNEAAVLERVGRVV